PALFGELVEHAGEVLSSPRRRERRRLERHPVDGDRHAAGAGDRDDDLRENNRQRLALVTRSRHCGALIAWPGHHASSRAFGITEFSSRFVNVRVSVVMRLVVSKAASSAGWSWCCTTKERSLIRHSPCPVPSPGSSF